MPKNVNMKGDTRDGTYHDAHMDDPEEWDEASAEDVIPKPSGMVVFSLRLPTDEFAALRQAAARTNTTMSDLARAALRYYLTPRATGSLSATAIQVRTLTPAWTGGVLDPQPHVRISETTPPGGTARR